MPSSNKRSYEDWEHMPDENIYDEQSENTAEWKYRTNSIPWWKRKDNTNKSATYEKHRLPSKYWAYNMVADNKLITEEHMSKKEATTTYTKSRGSKQHKKRNQLHKLQTYAKRNEAKTKRLHRKATRTINRQIEEEA